jgi:hypothetical protein
MAHTRHIIQEIAAMPRAEIESELADAQQQKRDLDEQINALTAERESVLMEEQLLAQVLRLHQWSDQGIAGAREALEVNAASAPEAKRANVSANILSLVRQADGASLSPKDVLDGLARHGIQSDLNAVRVALRRWSDRGEILKEGSTYRVPSTPTSLIPQDQQE